jgi:hypothetical protein
MAMVIEARYFEPSLTFVIGLNSKLFHENIESISIFFQHCIVSAIIIVTSNGKHEIKVKVGSPAGVFNRALVVIIILVIVLQPAGWC